MGHSAISITTPLMPHMPFAIAAAQRYDPKAGTGTLISLMLPYSVSFLVIWTVLLLVFYTRWAGTSVRAWGCGSGSSSPRRQPT